ncbi:MAG: S1C family serine protease [Bacillota bacterium]
MPIGSRLTAIFAGCLLLSGLPIAHASTEAQEHEDGTMDVQTVLTQDAELTADNPTPDFIKAQSALKDMLKARRFAFADNDMKPMLVGVNLNAKLEKGTFLGISTSPVPQVLRQQLKLQNGVGLVVDHVDSGSPAEAAGIKRYDVLQKLNDQLLVNAQQLSVLIRSFKPGEEVTLSLIREGKPTTLTAKLAEKDLPPLDAENPWPGPINLLQEMRIPGPLSRNFDPFIEKDGSRSLIYKDDQRTLNLIVDPTGKKRLLVQGPSGETLVDTALDTEAQREKLASDVREKLKSLEKYLTARITAQKSTSNVVTQTGQKTTQIFQWSDNDHSITITANHTDQGKPQLTLTAKDRFGADLFNGPIDTEEQRKALPDDIKRELESPAWKSILEELRSSSSKSN